MDLVFKDSNFRNITNPIDDYKSFTWRESWYSAGDFQLHLHPYRFAQVRDAEYLYNQDTDECAIVTNVNYTNEANGKKLQVSGVALESKLNQRTIDIEVVLNGNIEDIVYDIVTQFAMTGDRAIPKLTLAPKKGFSEVYEGTAAEGTQLGTFLYDALKPFEMSYKITYINDTSGGDDILVFSVEKGLDRTQSQDINTWAIFTTNFENLKNVSYTKIKTDRKNYVYAVGEYDESRIVEIVDNTNGGERFELYINPTISDEDGDISTLEEYRAVLKQKAVEALEKYNIIENVRGDIDPTGSLKYGVNYNLGDWCDIVVPEINFTWSAQLTGVDHVYESAGYRIVPQFGERTLNTREIIQRELEK